MEQPLLPTPTGPSSSPLARSGSGAPIVGELNSMVRAELVSQRNRDCLVTLLLAVGTISASLAVIVGLGSILFGDSSQRTWLLFGTAYYIGQVGTAAWEKLLWRWAQHLYVRVIVRRISQQTLYDAITTRLEAEADKNPENFSSRDCEAYSSYDKEEGTRTVKFSFWGVHKHSVRLKLYGGAIPSSASDLQNTARRMSCRSVIVEYKNGDDIICGRDSHVEANASIVLWLKTSRTKGKDDKQLLASWCEDCLEEALKPPPDRVDVYGPQESSSDWVHEWALERTKVFKSSGRVGTQFYLERQDCEEIRADAELWAHRSLRLYMVTGPPGVGKTEFTVWLAGRMGLPIYRLSLTTPRLTDARLSQLLSQNSMKHQQVLVQIDEFQEVLRRWQAEPKSIDITPGGFNEVLQGSATLTRGVIVLTGLVDVVSEVNLNAHQALYRRFHVKVSLGYLGRSDIETFFQAFP